jgi:3-deoxy-manno-octulosonate cytidylyltransferase (CMP-KDO synthetase)
VPRGAPNQVVAGFVVDFAVPVSLPFKLTESSVVAVIPARYQSTRLPAKLLADIAGRPMIEHVYRRASDAQLVDAVIVAADDERIADAVKGFGGAVCMTRADHASGTDRIAEITASISCRLVLNLQGDEPLVDPSVIDGVIAPLLADSALEMSTACRPVRNEDEFTNPNVVKVVRDARGDALYFSRAPVPWPRSAPTVAPAAARVHLGLYAYRRDVLLRLASLPPTDLEQIESLEQLRALAHGIRIRVVDTDHDSVGVDTAEDLARVRQRMLAETRT